MSVNNIINCFNLATKKEISDGLTWYYDARRVCRKISKDTNTKFIITCGVMAALSPFCPWEQNKKDCLGYIKDSSYTPVTFGNNRAKADEILSLENPTKEKILKILNGQKISRFFLNILSKKFNVVTIDRHAISLYFGTLEHNFKETPKRVKKIREDYKKAAKILNIRPYQLQAITWLTWRRLIA